jgi:hypothetical protein
MVIEIRIEVDGKIQRAWNVNGTICHTPEEIRQVLSGK